MNPRDLSDRELFRFSGPPENWITAIKFMTWGLEEKHVKYWQNIEPGDIFLMHSMTTNTIVKGAPSSVIGFGVVGPDFRKKDPPLWLEEIMGKKNKWPLLVPFSEIYLFSELRPPELLEVPDGKNDDLVINESKELLGRAVPISSSFPKMGSFSRVRPEVVVSIFKQAERFYLYSSVDAQETYESARPLKEIERPAEALRKPITLKELQVIKKKTVLVGKTTYAKDFQLLEKAESAHHETLSRLMDLLRSKGYRLYDNRHVDLFATKDNVSFLFEVKSLAGKNFKSQARKGIVQLFEYEYFEIREFFGDEDLAKRPNKALVFSQSPTDSNYIEFINNLKLGAGHFAGRNLEAVGQRSAFTGLI